MIEIIMRSTWCPRLPKVNDWVWRLRVTEVKRGRIMSSRGDSMWPGPVEERDLKHQGTDSEQRGLTAEGMCSWGPLDILRGLWVGGGHFTRCPGRNLIYMDKFTDDILCAFPSTMSPLWCFLSPPVLLSLLWTYIYPSIHPSYPSIHPSSQQKNIA